MSQDLIPNEGMKSDEWESLISEGLNAREEKDKIQWKLGDLAMQVQTVWGKDALGIYSSSIYVDKSTLARYRDVSKKIPQNLRGEFKHLSWSHFRIAAGTAEPKTWLEKASDGNWSAENFAIQMKKARGEHVESLAEKVKVVECRYCRKLTLDGPPGKICEKFHDCKKSRGE